VRVLTEDGQLIRALTRDPTATTNHRPNVNDVLGQVRTMSRDITSVGVTGFDPVTSSL
jgi:hypothetical protein